MDQQVSWEQKQKIIVCITGAAGSIASYFIPLLLEGQVLPNKKIDLRLLDIPQMENKLKGLILQIEDSCYPLLQSIQYGFNPQLLFTKVDLVVFLGGFPRLKGMNRRDLLVSNKIIFKQQGKALKNACKHTRCVVVSNPANTNAYILAKNSQHFINKKNITCLTRLDQNRALNFLANAINSPFTLLDRVVVWGNHSLTQCPDFSNTLAKGQLIQLPQKTRAQIVQHVQTRGEQIIKTRGFSSNTSAAKAIKDHIRDWFLGSQGRWVSMGICSEGEYEIPKGIFSSMPVTTKDFTYQVVSGLKLNDQLLKDLKISIDELMDQIKQVEQ